MREKPETPLEFGTRVLIRAPPARAMHCRGDLKDARGIPQGWESLHQ